MNRTDEIARDWPTLAQEAARMHAARQRYADKLGQAGDPRAAEEADRARVMGALASMWAAVVARQDEPELQASHAEIRQDLAGIRDTLAQRAATAPDEANAMQLARIQALIYHHAPWWPHCDRPHILFLHQVNLAARARWPRGDATEGGTHVDRSAERAALRQEAARMPRAVSDKPQPQQAGLF
ncbi:hypothetical protein [Sphingomonas sp. R1]|uniref:hypothetical protein n=1 Tax=Sphingomonas sp. R1 TaxID=399176 RepID=UPI00222584F9|nr:hypothetical protein [Sphingomonas sp. R1]UYY77763.1 hypothetical protein OIM94_01790 [Sphingomonas sp. R1]